MKSSLQTPGRAPLDERTEETAVAAVDPESAKEQRNLAAPHGQPRGQQPQRPIDPSADLHLEKRKKQRQNPKVSEET